MTNEYGSELAVPDLDMAPILPAVGSAAVSDVSRAIAEVQAAVVVAQARPRNMDQAVNELLRSCQQPLMAEHAFYAYPRGGKTISGPNVHLMREALRCFRNAQSGVVELRRFPGGSEMMAWAWDLQNNVRKSTTFINPHIRERDEDKGGDVELDSVRDVYEINANMAARREREMIKQILPKWYVAMAEATCHTTLRGTPAEFPERLNAAIAKYAEMGVTMDMLVRRLGAPRPAWAPVDLSTLIVLYRAIERGETSAEAQFDMTRPSGASAADTVEAAGRQQAKSAAKPRSGKGSRRGQQDDVPPPPDDPPPDDPPDGGSSGGEGDQPPAGSEA